jgi:AcrR family transcriptional regulator
MRARADTGERPDRVYLDTTRRAQIVRAAIETIAEVGYVRTSFVRISDHAGLSSTGMISYHFKSKEALYAEVVRTVLASSAEYMRARLREAEGRAAQLRAYITSNLAYIKENSDEISALLAILRNTAAGGDWSGDSIALLEQHLRTGQETGEFGEFDPLVMAITIRQAIDGVHGLLAADPEADVDAYGRELIRIFNQAIHNNNH